MYHLHVVGRYVVGAAVVGLTAVVPVVPVVPVVAVVSVVPDPVWIII